ncbi:MAG: hypothetical protein CL677_07845 [Bdellovibrionaceae bacterium]|nr:hypothetical protein [Pseudobdellovibrionaceae bacterium]|tara:strand:- start:70 stop:444 length:375 start_codon:yes stop_codon:yes gene_type:complete
MGKSTTGILEGQLKPCPESPNCVCSFQHKDDEEHYIAPETFSENPIEKLAALLEKQGLKIVEKNETYLHATDTSLIFRFVDDFEALYDGDTQTLHFRSASRLGRSDFGVNRKRVEKIKSLLQKQ